MPRNQYATPKGDVLVGATFTIRQLRNAYSENGGPLTPRIRRFLRTFVPPVRAGTGLDTEIAIMIPLSTVLEKAPPAVRQRMRPHFERVTPAWLAARPWIGGGGDVDPTTIDAELGSELENGARAGWRDEE